MADDPEPSQAPVRARSLTTSDGLALAAELALPPDPVGAVVLAHPHPLHGGSMRSLVISELFRALPARGIAALRFDFRGVGGSEGAHGEGVGERLDVGAAIDALAGATPARPLVLAGWSFGGDVSASVVDDRLAGWFLMAPPLRTAGAREGAAATDPRPKVVAVPEHDEYLPPAEAREATAAWANTTVEVVPGADHYFVGRTTHLADLLVHFIRTLPH